MTDLIVFFLLLLGAFGIIKLVEFLIHCGKQVIEYFWEGEE
jgi:hypothetical protein